MSYTPCKECRRDVSIGARRCPHCGVRNPANRGHLLRLTLLFVIVSAAGVAVALRGTGMIPSKEDVFASARERLAPDTVAPVAKFVVPVLIDVPSIAGRTPAEVSKVLGRPSRTDRATVRGRTYPSRFYMRDRVQVVFVNDRADWITLHRAHDLTFDPMLIQALGFPPALPTVAGSEVLRWERLPGVKDVSAFPGDSARVEYVAIFVATEP